MKRVVAFHMGEAPDATPLGHCRVIYEVRGLKEIEGWRREQGRSFRKLRGAGGDGHRLADVGVRVRRVIRHKGVHLRLARSRARCSRWTPRPQAESVGSNSVARTGTVVAERCA
uniref:Uncharacterized protein n=1 Tax=Arundo donax TaxID=35708 RepID=A0A0A9GBK7_ARUDO